jgi:hypothetical protein
MEAVAHNPAFAKKAGVPMSVGKDFSSADKGRKFSKGGDMNAMDKKQDVAMIKKAFKQHDMQEHKGGKGTTLKLAKGGYTTAADGCAQRGKTKGTQIKMMSGGAC